MLARTTLTLLILATLTTATAAAAPSLTITQARVNPPSASVGDSLTLSARVRNNGNQPIAAGKLRAEFTLISPTGAQIQAGTVSTTENLAAGSECGLQVTWSSAGAAAGTYSLKVRAICVDGGVSETTNILQGTPRLGIGGAAPPPTTPKPSGSLTVEVWDWDGDRGDGTVELTRGGVRIGEKGTSAGRAEWTGLELGDYAVSVRRSREGVEERWGSAAVKVAGPTAYKFTRTGLVVTQLSVDGKAGGWPVSSQAGTPVKIAATVRNPGSSSVSGKVRFALDRDQAGGSDHEHETQPVSVPAGSERVFEWTVAPTTPGVYSLRATVYGDQGGYQPMSHSGWAPAVSRVALTTSLQVSFLDESGAPAECVASLTSAAGAPLGERVGSAVEWVAVPLGVSRLEVRRASSEGLGLRELWASTEVTVSGPAAITVRRQNPVVSSVEVNGQLERSLPVPAASASVRVTVRNPGAASRGAKVRLILDRDGEQPYDFDVTSPAKTLGAGGEAAFEFQYTPREGTYRLAAVALVESGEWEPSDQRGWLTALVTTRGVLRVVVRDENGALTPEGKVVRLDSVGKRLDEASIRNGSAEWAGVAEGSYTLEVYAGGGEYWGSAKAQVKDSAQVEFLRRAERVTRLEAPAYAYAGDPARLVLHVTCTEASRLTRVRISTTAEGASKPCWEATAERKVTAGADISFEFTFTPAEAARYGFRAEVTGDYSGLRLTDVAEWSGALTARAPVLTVEQLEPGEAAEPPVAFRVRVTRDGHPVAAAEVTVKITGSVPWEAGGAKTGADGVATVAGWISEKPGEAAVMWRAEARSGAAQGSSPEKPLRVRALESGYAATPEKHTVTYKGSAYTATRVVPQQGGAASLPRSWLVADSAGKTVADPEAYAGVAVAAEAYAGLPSAGALREEARRLGMVATLGWHPKALAESALLACGGAAGASGEVAKGDRGLWLSGLLYDYMAAPGAGGWSMVMAGMLGDAAKLMEEAAALSEKGPGSAEAAASAAARGLSLARVALRGLAMAPGDAGRKAAETLVWGGSTPAQARAAKAATVEMLKGDAGVKRWASECGGALERLEQAAAAARKAAGTAQGLLLRGTLGSAPAEPAARPGYLRVEAEASAAAGRATVKVRVLGSAGEPAAAAVKVTLWDSAGGSKTAEVESGADGVASAELDFSGSSLVALAEARSSAGTGSAYASCSAPKAAVAAQPASVAAVKPAGEGSVALILSAGSIRPVSGGSFTLDVRVEASRGVQCGEFAVEYDAGRLSLDAVALGDLFGGKAARISEGSEAGRLLLVLGRGDSAPAQSAGSAARLTFIVLSGSGVEVKLASAKLSDQQYRELAGVSLAGYAASLGAASVDATGDGVLDYRDAAAVTASYGSSRGQQAYSAAADLDEDGRVGLKELALVASQGRAPAAQTGHVTLTVKTPASIREGEEFTATVEAAWNGAPPAGCEAQVRVDARGLRIKGVEKGDAFTNPILGALRFSAQEGTATIALAGTPAEGGGSIIRLRLLPLGVPGSFQVAVEKASFADSAGKAVAASLPPAQAVQQAAAAQAAKAVLSAGEEPPLLLVGGVGAAGILGASMALTRRQATEQVLPAAPLIEPTQAPAVAPRRRRVTRKARVSPTPEEPPVIVQDD